MSLATWERSFAIADSICGGTFCNKCGVQPDQPDRSAESHSGSFYRSCMGSCGIYHDHCTEDQGQAEFGGYLKGFTTPITGYDAV